MHVRKDLYPIHVDYTEYVGNSGRSLNDVDPQLAETISELINPDDKRLPWELYHQRIDSLIETLLLDNSRDPNHYAAATDIVVDKILRPIAGRNYKAELATWVYDIDLSPYADDTDLRDMRTYLLRRALMSLSTISFAFSCLYQIKELNEEDRDEPSNVYKLLTMSAVHALGDAHL